MAGSRSQSTEGHRPQSTTQEDGAPPHPAGGVEMADPMESDDQDARNESFSSPGSPHLDAETHHTLKAISGGVQKMVEILGQLRDTATSPKSIP